ncbi:MULTISPECIES: pyridoxamine 5'-phosphate oxidase [Thalassobaculum]|uniref:Pyridoxine/pyridoxamine 5'-phosphate oxidase n=1 Tax=Thalassobaculum litoreum DSM 18839 TaxID=1123362 RepID=A0A8G2BIG1_9PROT|nr:MULTISPECIES: pyridoxamine 5'-phosphate oxidase [Thalassobaculum]SDF88532.1 Pyridoxamine 5'-phosphate oxidase [Thalassobaculum litoreum DSM 18839]
MSDDKAIFEPQTDDPFEQFRLWFAEAEASEVNDANAMTLATAGSDGRPSARIVLMKDYDESGVVFYTNTESQKGLQLAVNPFAALLFHWKSLRRQVRFEGAVTPVTAAEADDYYDSRPRNSRIGAWASQQSRPLADRATLMQSVERFSGEYPGEAVPRPPYWSGYRLSPLRIEFWHDGAFRLHDRFVFTRQAEGQPWSVQRLYP